MVPEQLDAVWLRDPDHRCIVALDLALAEVGANSERLTKLHGLLRAEAFGGAGLGSLILAILRLRGCFDALEQPMGPSVT